MTHTFGGEWTAAKLKALNWYLKVYTGALKGQPFELVYMDGFAGEGRYLSKTSGDGEELPGSVEIALETPGFARYLFVEKSRRRVEKLKLMATGRGMNNVTVLHGDANQMLQQFCREADWHRQRAVLFLDPYGLHVSWSTLQCIAATRSIDVWYLFPLSGITRQLPRAQAKQDQNKRDSITRILGTDRWQEFYQPPRMEDLFDIACNEREADSNAIAEFVTRRLREAFPVVLDPIILRKGSRGNPSAGPPLFALYFMMANEKPTAVGLAKRLANGVIDALRKEGSIS